MKTISFMIIATAFITVSLNADSVEENQVAIEINKIKNFAYSKKLEDKRELMSQEREDKATIRNYKELIASL